MPRALSRAVLAGASITLVGMTMTGCTAPPMPTPTPTATFAPTGDGILRIGTFFPRSGPLAGSSAAQVAGINAAVREIDAAGGVLGAPVEVVSRNSGKDDSGKAAPSFDELVARGVDVVIGPSSSVVAEQVIPNAAAASVPLISPSATGSALTSADDAGWFFRTIPTDADLGAALAALLVEKGATNVVLVEVGGQPGSAEALASGLTAQDAELTEVPGDGDPAIVAQQVAAAAPDAVVLATPGGGDATAAVIAALVAGGYGGSALWLVGPAAVGYGDALPAGTLEGVIGIAAGFSPDDAFRERARLEDPGVHSLRYAAEAYDATILAALAATLAGDDGGASIARNLPAAAAGGIPCHSYGECLDVLATQDDIDYQGVTGPLDLDENGDLLNPGFAVYGYTAENALQFAEWLAK